MYKAYLRDQTTKGADVAETTERQACEDVDDDADIDEDIRNEVSRIWHNIEKQCQDKEFDTSVAEDGSNAEVLDWHTVHVFVSSTFTDFFCEREVLVKKVFPELREWCHEKGLKLVECDLRWGIPKDTSTGDVILVCLDEIERCREVNKDQPFFINLLGERYGWIPSSTETPDEAKEKYGWVDGTSITFMEIFCGAYRDKNPNAAFFMRNKAVCDNIPESFHKRFIDNEPLARHHLKVLKRKVQEKFPDHVFPYSCKFQQISTATGREQVELTGFGDFAEKVTNFLKSAIERTYPNTRQAENEVDVNKQERDLQWLFAVDKAKGLIGRQSELEMLKEFVEHGTSSNMKETGQTKDWDLHETDKKICVLEGESGWGKSALISKLIVDSVKSGCKVFFHIVNSTPVSNHVDSLLKRLLDVLKPQLTEEEKSVMETEDVGEMQKLLRTALSDYRKKEDSKLVIIIDGLNELENRETVSHLSWLPPFFPNNIHCLVSTNPHLPTTARIYEHPTLKMTLQAMTTEDLSTLAVRHLETFQKKLDSDQLERLVTKTGVDNPLWMMLMAEELRIFGDYRLMNSKIDNFPDTMEGFLSQIIDRLIQEDDENDVIRKVLCLIACSRHGLPSEIVLQICGNVETKEELAPLYWAQARRSLKPYLRVFGSMEEVITFSHEAVLKAVHSNLLSSREDLEKWHTVLADYYQYWCLDPRAKVYHLPYHLERAGLKKRLVEFMQKDPDSYIRMNPWMRSSLLKNARCRSLADAVIPATAPVMLCHMCSNFNKGFNPRNPWQNKKCCVLCGALCQGSKAIAARACMRHAERRGPNMVKCLLCNFMVKTDAQGGVTAGSKAQLCTHCGFGNGDRTCARFDIR